ncbi:MAG: hypothetical protein QM757_12030, partial [Paludibaculum sp.]
MKVDTPAGVIGYAIFRQSIQGRADQEAVVPLTGTALSSSTLIWDDTAFATAVGVANPTGAAALVNVEVLDANGAQIGLTTMAVQVLFGFYRVSLLTLAIRKLNEALH